MGEDITFRLIMILAVIITALVHERPERRERISQPVTTLHERLIPIVFSSWAASIVAYILGFWVAALMLPIPVEARWAGAVLGLISILLSTWTQRTIGNQFSHRLEVWKDHQLVTEGPYRFVRHPRYAIFFLSAIAASLVTANAAVCATSLLAAVVLTPRIRKEERLMLSHFGEQYRAYMQTTGAIVPRVRK